MPRHARRLADDAGQGLIEYALILGLTSLGIALALLVLRNSIVNPVQGSSDRIEAAGLAPPGLLPGGTAGGVPGGAANPAGGAGHGHGNGQGNSGNGNGNGGPNGGNNGHSGGGNNGNGNGNGGPR